MTERKGSRMKWLAECGHWMVVYSLEPTPAQCPECRDQLRKELEDTFRIDPCLTAETESFSRDEFPSCPEPLADALESACTKYDEAAQLVEDAQYLYEKAKRLVDEALDRHLPWAERLTMPESAA